MQTLAIHEIDQVAGGDDWGVMLGAIAATIHEAGVYGALVGASFFGGVALGGAFNSWFEGSYGESFGSWLYDIYN